MPNSLYKYNLSNFNQIGGSLSIAPNGMPSGSASYSQTNGERRFVDSPTTFIIGDGSNLKVGKVENTAGAIGATGNGKLSIDEYVGHNLENVDKSKTVGGSVGISTSGINSIGINYNDRKQEGTTKNTVIGNVEIGKSSGDEINKDLGSMTEITKDRDFKTDINIESQTINYIKNPEAFKQDLKKAKNEIEDIGNVIENTVNPPGEDKRNFFKNLRAQRWTTSFYNVTGSRMEELSRKFKAGEIDENQLKEAVRELAKGYGKDIGIEYEVVYLDEETMPEDAKGSTGSSYILDKKNKKVLIPIDVSKIGDINELLGTLTEEISHGKDALEGRQDKKVAEDKSNDEEGLESLGRPANDYVKNKLGDNSSDIQLSTDGIDLTNADVGEKVGDYMSPEDLKYRKYYREEELPKIDKVEMTFDTVADFYSEKMEKDFKNLKNKENVLKYKKIYQENLELGKNKLDKDENERNAKRNMVKEMSKEISTDTMISEVSKDLLSIYGASAEIRALLLTRKKEKAIIKGKKRNEIREILILDDIISEKKMQLLWARPKSTKNINKVVKFWKEKMKNNETFTLEYDDREKSRNTLNFTGDREFYAFGTTTLYQSTYGTITKTEDGKYDVDIKVLFQYKDKFDDVKNINPLPDAKQDRKKEFKGGRGFYFETEVKEVQIKQKVSSLDQFGLGRIIENEMQFGEKIYENNKK